jgi:hypothetical protein
MGASKMAEPGGYRIQVQGWIGERWAGWFDDMAMTFERGRDGTPVTTLSGTVADQAALRGILSKIWDLNLTLLSVTRFESKGARSDE